MMDREKEKSSYTLKEIFSYMYFSQEADGKRYKGMWVAFKNIGNDRYPDSIISAYETLCKYRGSTRGHINRRRENIPDVAFK